MEQYRRYQKNRLSLGKKRKKIREVQRQFLECRLKEIIEHPGRTQGSTGQVQHVSAPGSSGHAHRPTGPSQDSQQIVPVKMLVTIAKFHGPLQNPNFHKSPISMFRK